jgi:hypothetical protein
MRKSEGGMGAADLGLKGPMKWLNQPNKLNQLHQLIQLNQLNELNQLNKPNKLNQLTTQGIDPIL